MAEGLAPAEPPPPPPPLDAGTVAGIAGFLQANGGQLTLGKVTRQFRGVKKAQLLDHFVFTTADNPNDPIVSLGGAVLPPAPPLQVRPPQPVLTFTTVNSPHLGSTAPAAVEVPPMDATRVEEVAAILQANGGAMSLGKLTRQFRGAKKAQLEQHFSVDLEDGAPDFVVSLGPGAGGPVSVPSRSFGMAGQGAGLHFGGPNPTVSCGSGARQAAAAPVAPLSPQALQSVAQALQEQGGVMSLGKVTRMFPGLKKAQLVGHFHLGTDRNLGPVVSLSETGLAGGLAGGFGAGPGAGLGAGLGNGLGNGLGAGPTGGLSAGLGGGLHAGLNNGLIAPPGLGLQGGPGQAAPGLGTAPGEAAEVRPLPPARINELATFLRTAGGSVPLGRLTRQFRGIKKAQLSMHFVLRQDAGEPDIMVALHGAAGAPNPGRKRPRPEGMALAPAQQQPGQEEVQPLDAAKVAEVATFLGENGGSLSLGKITRQFRGLKKVQLQQHFAFIISDNPQDPLVALGEPNMDESLKRGRFEGGEVEDLDPQRLTEIISAVLNTGTLALNELMRQFPGVQQSQLEHHFALVWDPAAGDFMVNMTDSTLS